jgi:GYF domain 2
MSSPAAQTQWYLARDGQQFGPLSEAELHRFVDLGHLQPTDLLWREGFPDWRPAMVVFPPRSSAMGRPGPAARPGQLAPRSPAQQAPAARERMSGTRSKQAPRESYHAPEIAPRGRGLRRTLVVIVCLGLLAAGGWYASARPDMFFKLVGRYATWVPAGLSDMATSKFSMAPKNLETSPFKGLTGPADTLEPTLQATPLWRVLKRDYPDWYADRLKEIAALAADNKDDLAIGQQLARALVTLRRQNAGVALAAGFPQLKAVATSFYENLVQLGKHSNEACFEFISKGEAGPLVVSLMQNPDFTPQLQAQLLAVFEAIADGRKTARAYPQPRKSDYDALAADLTRRGWSQADLQLFSDERALSNAGPAKVCQMVRDWFAAQLAIKDPDMQLRLLVESLKPIVAG